MKKIANNRTKIIEIIKINLVDARNKAHLQKAITKIELKLRESQAFVKAHSYIKILINFKEA